MRFRAGLYEYLLSGLSLALAGTLPMTLSAGTLKVGPGKTHLTVPSAVNAARDRDLIEIHSGDYLQSAGWARITKHNLTLRGVGPTPPALDAAGYCLFGKAIFIIAGTNTTLENLEFKNARNPDDLNAAGIRQEAAHLTVRNCHFHHHHHHNDDGILTGATPNSAILIESCEFDHNGFGDGQSHDLYIGTIASFTLQYCHVHHAVVGHELK